jgi:dTDP-4-dehydrorhamnose 3,5-epimerase
MRFLVALMIFHKLPLSGAFLIEPQPRQDDRGFFARTFCVKEFETHGLSTKVAQCNMSFNHNKGTVRGLHYQLEPASEAKLIRCTRGAIYDVMVDMRPSSPTYLQYFGVELSADNRVAAYVPEMFAHGYQALTGGAEACYQVSEVYAPELEKGIRYDDPALGIRWPLPVTTISEKDLRWPLLPAAVRQGLA